MEVIKIPPNYKILFEEDTGQMFEMCYVERYINWLESKLTEAEKQIEEMKKRTKSAEDLLCLPTIASNKYALKIRDHFRKYRTEGDSGSI